MGMVWLTWPIFACATVDLEKFLHGMLLTEINDAVNDGPVFVAPLTVEASVAIH